MKRPNTDIEQLVATDIDTHIIGPYRSFVCVRAHNANRKKLGSLPTIIKQ